MYAWIDWFALVIAPYKETARTFFRLFALFRRYTWSFNHLSLAIQYSIYIFSGYFGSSFSCLVHVQYSETFKLLRAQSRYKLYFQYRCHEYWCKFHFRLFSRTSNRAAYCCVGMCLCNVWVMRQNGEANLRRLLVGILSVAVFCVASNIVERRVEIPADAGLTFGLIFPRISLRAVAIWVAAVLN